MIDKRALALLSGAAVAGAMIAAPGHAAEPHSVPQWQLTDTGVDNQFRGLSAVDGSTAWVAGTDGTVLRTTDGGDSWANVSPPDTTDLEFRDIEAFDDQRAVILSIGEGEASQVMSTDDGGASWHTGFVNQEPTAFYNCLAFFDDTHGIAMSDPVDGRIRFITTDDAGASWEPLPPEQSPEAADGQVAFSASGQCVVTGDDRNAYLVTGGTAGSRIVHTGDRGQTWDSYAVGVPGGETAGLNAAAFRDPRHGIVVGGDFETPDDAPDGAAYTRKGPDALTPAADGPGEYRSAVSYLVGGIAITVGPTGSDLTLNGGRDWRKFDDGAFDTVDCAQGACWASGPDGAVAALRWW